ncbi:MAG TPA: CoA-acylating methylmalonate-semialdehyde dehydrogenase [Chloroflexota bacterium]|jgi:malonate-semialdehyde dehydrogenase (acetylating)/methylmalonate-semialdehyde dehydrogenase
MATTVTRSEQHTSTTVRKLRNYVNGQWVEAGSGTLEVRNPATNQVLAQVPLSTKDDVERAVAAARAAFPAWRATPVLERARYLFKVRQLMEEHLEELAQILVSEVGKALPDARLEIKRGIEMVEVATGMPTLMMGNNLEDISRDIDCDTIRQPIGVFAAITPYNFPSMVPLWFLPFAVASGNTFVLKPSEQVPLSSIRLYELMEQVGFPHGVINLVNGAHDAVNGLLESKGVNGISFVGSAATAKYVYARAAENGKRVQALGGAKNHLVVMPDCEMEKTLSAIMSSSFGAAGQRCLAGSVVVAVGDVYDSLKDGLLRRARGLKVQDGMLEDTDVGPVVSTNHKSKVEGWIEKGLAEGADLILDGRQSAAASGPGCFLGPSIFDKVTPEMEIAREEIFGPVVCVIQVKDLDEALAVVNASRYGNATSIFTTSGKAVRQYKYEVQVGMIGVNIGVAAPMAFFTFTGWKDSFFGDLHAHGADAISFYTEKKTIISRWF